MPSRARERVLFCSITRELGHPWTRKYKLCNFCVHCFANRDLAECSFYCLAYEHRCICIEVQAFRKVWSARSFIFINLFKFKVFQLIAVFRTRKYEGSLRCTRKPFSRACETCLEFECASMSSRNSKMTSVLNFTKITQETFREKNCV